MDSRHDTRNAGRAAGPPRRTSARRLSRCPHGPWRRRWPGLLLGIAVGGFFDGILLHQILQWHHLLSAIDPGNARFQVAADGYFHLLMYLLAALGVWGLWSLARRKALPPPRALGGDLLCGFGAWHVLDAAMSHWLLGIHRIRMDSATPLVWDLLWFVLFGIAPLVAGVALRRAASGDRPPGGGSGGGHEGGHEGGGTRAGAMAAAAMVLAAGLGIQALRPATGGSPFATVLFAPGTSSPQVLAAVAALDARLVWSDTSGELVVIAPPAGRSLLPLLAHGAILFGGASLPLGCFAYLGAR